MVSCIIQTSHLFQIWLEEFLENLVHDIDLIYTPGQCSLHNTNVYLSKLLQLYIYIMHCDEHFKKPCFDGKVIDLKLFTSA